MGRSEEGVEGIAVNRIYDIERCRWGITQTCKGFCIEVTVVQRRVFDSLNEIQGFLEVRNGACCRWHFVLQVVFIV
jgi:hypothetical protein